MPAIYREPLCLSEALLPPGRCPAPPQPELPDLHRSYELMRQTKILPLIWVFPIRWILAGCSESLLEVGPSRRYLCGSFPGCLDPYSGSLQGANSHYFPWSFGLPRNASGSAVLRPSAKPIHDGNNISKLQSFTNVQASRFAHHPVGSHTGQVWSSNLLTKESVPNLIRSKADGGFYFRAERKAVTHNAHRVY